MVSLSGLIPWALGVGEVILTLASLGGLVKIRSGIYDIYAKAYISENLNKPVMQGWFGQACKETLTKKGVKWQSGSAGQAYNDGI